jgi:Family of unknown function (DUF5662)
MAYDSTDDTKRHIEEVRKRLLTFAAELLLRGDEHDKSKLGPNEKPIFDDMMPRLKTLAYGTQEYKDSRAALGPALIHHYQNNSHHPEHYQNGVAGMCLLDLVEMYCDWQAAAMRNKNCDFTKGLGVNVERFKIDPQLAQIFRNTFERHGDLNTDLPKVALRRINGSQLDTTDWHRRVRQSRHPKLRSNSSNAGMTV